MSPLDDELRGALSSRTRAIAPSPDLMSGIERRAQRMRRQKVAAAVAGSAVAVTALGLGGPLLASSLTSTAPGPADLATAAPTPTPAPADRFALDPADPWAYRGDDGVLENGNLETVAREWAVRHAAEADAIRFSPLYGELDEPSAAGILVFVAREAPDAVSFWGVAVLGEGGPELLVDAPLASGTTGLPVALPGEAVSRLLVVAHEDTTVEYCPAGEGSCGPIGDGGIGRAPLDADPALDTYRVLAPDGSQLVEGPAPDGEVVEGEPEGPGTGTVPDEAPEVPAGTPSNAVLWPTRGSATPQLVDEALRAFARDTGTTRDRVDGRLLYGSDRDGRHLLLLSAWQRGQDARTYGYLEAAGSGSGFLGGPTAPGPAALAVLVPAEAVFEGTDWLLVVPEPPAGEVLYSPDGTSEPQAVPDQGTGAAVVVERAPGAAGDQLLVLDDARRQPIYRGTVDELLATMR